MSSIKKSKGTNPHKKKTVSPSHLQRKDSRKRRPDINETVGKAKKPKISSEHEPISPEVKCNAVKTETNKLSCDPENDSSVSVNDSKLGSLFKENKGPKTKKAQVANNSVSSSSVTKKNACDTKKAKLLNKPKLSPSATLNNPSKRKKSSVSCESKSSHSVNLNDTAKTNKSKTPNGLESTPTDNKNTRADTTKRKQSSEPKATRRQLPTIPSSNQRNQTKKKKLKTLRVSEPVSPVNQEPTLLKDSDSKESAEFSSANIKPEEYNPNDSSTDFLEDFLIPLLKSGREQSLYLWMASVNLLKKPEKCTNENCGDMTIYLSMTKVGTNKALWKCRVCHTTTHLRIGSFFKNITCSIQDTLYCIIAWCEQQPLENLQTSRDIKKECVRRIYSQCSETVESFINENAYDWHLGGVGSVALLDVWPNGYLPIPTHPKETNQSYKHRVKLVWLADTNCVPVKYWVHLLPPLQPLYQLFTPKVKKCLEESAKNIVSERNSPKEFLKSLDAREKRLKRRGILKEQQEIEELIEEHEELRPSQKEIENQKRDKSGKVEQADESQNEEKKVQKSNENQRKRKSGKVEVVEKLRKEIQKSEQTQPPQRSPYLKKDYSRIKIQLYKNKEDDFRKKELCEAVLSAIQNRIAPGSLVVANDKALSGICSSLQATGKYEAVMPVDNILAADDKGHTPTKQILDNIWKTACDMCGDFRTSTRSSASSKIALYQWNQMFYSQTSRAVYCLLTHIASHFVPQSAKPSLPTKSVMSEH